MGATQYTVRLVLGGGIANEERRESAALALLAAAAVMREAEQADPLDNRHPAVLVDSDLGLLLAVERRGSAWIGLPTDEATQLLDELTTDPNADSRLTARDLGLDRYAR